MTFPFPSICPGNSKPGPFSFANQVNVAVNTLCYSNVITPTGYDSPALVTPAGCEYSINGGAWTSLSTFIAPGQTIQLRATAAAAWGTARSVSISIDTTLTTWTITTGSVSGGAWDTGWTAGSWTVYTPQFFNWFRVQLWGPGGGGGGAPGSNINSARAGSGSGGGVAQFAGGPYATGGGGGTGGYPSHYGDGDIWYGYFVSGAPGENGAHGYGAGGDGASTGGGAAGGAGGVSQAVQAYNVNINQYYYFGGGAGGRGGNGGYCVKTYSWGQISPSTGYSAYIQGPGGGGGGTTGGPGNPGVNGAGGGYGRIYIDWG